MRLDETEWELIVAFREVLAYVEDDIEDLDPAGKKRIQMTKAVSMSKDLLLDYFLFLFDGEQFADQHIKPALLSMVRDKLSDN